MDEALVVCCSKTALEVCQGDLEMANSVVMTNIVPEGIVYVIDKEAFLIWLGENGLKGERYDTVAR